MIPDVEERSHIERYVGSNLIAAKSPNGYVKQRYGRQFQEARYPKFASNAPDRGNETNADERATERYPFSPKSGLYRADSRANCWSGYPLISFNAARRDNQNADQTRHYYANVGGTSKTYTAGKPSKCSYSDFVTNKQGVPLIQANKFQDKQNWERENRHQYYHKNGNAGNTNDPAKLVGDGRENRKNECPDENLANSENCLPRIIKPRKRRKKDRKPNAAFVSGTATQTQTVKKLQDKNDKPVAYKIHPYPDKSNDSIHPAHNLHLTLYRPKSSKSLAIYQDGNVSDLLISRSLVNLFSEESSQLSITDDLRFDNLIGKEAADGDQSTFCNCRYCDPQGVVWDIRQRCFSPNLMPPVNGAAKLVKNKDWSTTLKRSCSEPASKPTMAPVVSRIRALSDSYDTTNQNLQVSSQIVTSLNGHRDIEIKFFSSTAPTSKT